MNNKNTKMIILVFLLSQLFFTFQLNSVNNEITNLRNQNQSLYSQLNSQLSFSISDLNRLITESSSPIEHASITYGTFNKESLTVDVIINIVPKELTPTTAVFIVFNNEKMQLNRNDSVFSLSMEIDIFLDVILPMIIIEDNEKQVVTQEPRLNIYTLRSSVFPVINVEFNGSRLLTDRNVNINGQINVFSMFVDTDVKFNNYKVLYFLDNDVVGQQNLGSPTAQNGDFTVFNLKEFTLSKALPEKSLFSIVFSATNDLGLEHYILVSQSQVGENSGESCWIYNFERIYSPTKKLLWQTSEHNDAYCMLPIIK